MSHGRQHISQNPTSSSRVSSVSRVQDNTSNIQVTGTLRLRAEGDTSDTRDQTPARHIRWSQDVVDNEGMGKKSSKVCCIYHKTRPVGESSSESESSESESSDSDSDRGAGAVRSKKNCRQHNHDHGGSQSSPERARTPGDHGPDDEKRQRRKPGPNAYEKMPKFTKS
ncbi:PPP1R11/YPI1 family protein [Aspergillus puulaauensis]|uniref:Type 1 phosphatases regulator n=1 Tax=Aspergillus puulaauensis TaxID=1220207 RepID=A0A7R8AP51_9EURO|nr:type 1 phosphatases regulator Ypi1 [Aspergillus puulaauensis]BCS25587.1 type 1 phosphatases regulator Ypi1 [Aspergillus puulaauensis]